MQQEIRHLNVQLQSQTASRLALLCTSTHTRPGKVSKLFIWKTSMFSARFRGTGLGAKLMSHLALVANQKNCARFEWSVLDWNERAIGFYNRIGAKPVAGWTRYRIDPKCIA